MMEGKPKANLFVVGAMKAGTTSFVEALSQIPQVYMCPVKEPNYFVDEVPDILYDPSKFFNWDTYLKTQFPESLHIANVEREADYDKLFSLATEEKWLAEASTMYLHAPGVAEGIKSYNPEARIIILTRNPLTRAFSHYKMLSGLSREMKSFEDVLLQDITSFDRGQLPWYSYTNMSCYHKAIASFRSQFDRVLVVPFEEWVQRTPALIDELNAFLELPMETDWEVKRSNTTRSLRFKRLFYWLKRSGLKDYFSAIFGPKTKAMLFRWVSKKASDPMNLSETTQARFDEITANQ
ncbi:sulfotransferase [Aureisphaera galaxeae]|uniref:sulfotransferase family protein n=1 Tax=Aureisphaera galaxeae TaxID=1538023 RepID=UPI002350AC7C|nr:sulfotransferase [Aureisphaera galaxeae]MDC8004591.1 sulfotransferase [Aureisphaera galaxeae]